MRRYALLGPLVLLGVILASCGQVQSFETSSRTGAGWRAIGPEGIDVKSLTISPEFSSDQTLFVGLLGWDLGVFRSTDGGDSWEEVYEGLRGNVDTWVVISPDYASDGTLFAGKGNGGVFRSTDGGDSWKRVGRGIPRYEDSGECCGYYQTFAVKFSPAFANDGTLYLATWDGLFRSTDLGDSWQRLGQDLAKTRTIDIVLSPAFATDNTLFMVARSKDWDAGASLFQSTDRGDTWREAAPDLEVTWGRWVSTRLVVSPSFSTDGTLYAATLDGLLRSTDQGHTWRKVYSYDQVLEGNFEPWVVLSPNFVRDKTLFTSKVCEGVFRSTDGGDTWRDVTLALTVPSMALSPGHHTCDPPGFTSLAFSPSFAADSTLFVSTEVGIFQLSDFSVSEE